MTGLAEERQPHRGLLGRPRLVGVDHHAGLGAHRGAQQIEPREIPLGVRVADLDLEGREPEIGGAREEGGEGAVVHVEIEAGGVDGHAFAGAAEKAGQRQPGLLGGEIPQRDLQRLAEAVIGVAPVAAAGAFDPVDDLAGHLALEARPDRGGEDALQLGLRGICLPQGVGEAEAGATAAILQFQREAVEGIEAHLAVADHAVAAKLEARDAEVREAVHGHVDIAVRESDISIWVTHLL